MLQHILVAVDGSPPSRLAARFGLSLARQTKARVTLLTVLPPPEVMPMGPLSGYAVVSPPMSADDTKKVASRLIEMADEYPDVPKETAVELGPVVDTIVEKAKELGVDLVVVGARGLGAGRRFLLGSVSDGVVHHARCPVTVVR